MNFATNMTKRKIFNAEKGDAFSNFGENFFKWLYVQAHAKH